MCQEQAIGQCRAIFGTNMHADNRSWTVKFKPNRLLFHIAQLLKQPCLTGAIFGKADLDYIYAGKIKLGHKILA